ncbi:hypothetical protein A2899_05250 [Candidatus Amesbacteria bacterium RIFCSPLOWO2_01_FULL_49_25]|uniref:Uncharacterized protein n=1 Tax=Candidatus Amesbacteria bacterium RIFCSPHIGHO2_01_FULL_48_32b TaxID=1797253 RepID=A0A1F4YCA8_9BACT|nr:MAG: hypothetical protein A2876_03550 [Candidatus Amesbacteria bacterium RIFCSPHIGHO2_01_FULL_48_32b]OGD06761.1 MAG: hypothetical protein A2899_05250 [Candidatus Amesbacteria bacterium RIFCSPLOWO2_01_FULL_49_25]
MALQYPGQEIGPIQRFKNSITDRLPYWTATVIRGLIQVLQNLVAFVIQMFREMINTFMGRS